MILFYLLVTIMPMIRHPVWSDLLAEFTLVKYLGLACLAYALVYLVARARAPRFLVTWQERFFVALALLGMWSYLAFGVRHALEVSPFMSWLSFLMLWITAIIVLDSLGRLRSVLLMAIGSVAYGSLHVLREWQKYGEMSLGYRPGWVTGDPNYFSASALLCIPLALYLMRTKQPPWERWFCIISIVLTLLALTLAASRGGFLGFTLATVFVVCRTRRPIRNLAVAVAIVMPLMILTPSSPLQRLISPNSNDKYSADERTLLAMAGIEMLKQNPFTGVGAGNFKTSVRLFGQVNEDHIAHNTYVSVAAEMGLPAILLFMGVVVSTLWSLERTRRQTRDEQSGLLHAAACGLQAGFVAYFVAAFFISSETHKLFWMMVFISAVLPRLLATRRRRKAAGTLPGAVPSVPDGLATAARL